MERTYAIRALPEQYYYCLGFRGFRVQGLGFQGAGTDVKGTKSFDNLI